jgi:hypothetical protein
MADIVAANVTITVERKVIAGKRKRNRVKIAFGDSALTYPTGGVPLPAFGQFGMKRFLEYITLTDANDASGITWKFDQENKKLRAFVPGVEIGAAGAVALDDFPLTSDANTLATAMSVSLTGSIGAGVRHLGVQKELVNTQAPAAQILYAEAIGW